MTTYILFIALSGYHPMVFNTLEACKAASAQIRGLQNERGMGIKDSTCLENPPPKK